MNSYPKKNYIFFLFTGLRFVALDFLFPLTLPTFGFLFFLPADGVVVGRAGSGSAPLNRVRPSLRVSVITGLAAGRNWYSLEYLVII